MKKTRTSVTSVTAGYAAFALMTFVGCASPPESPAVADKPAPAHPEQALIDDLVFANRMLASQELGFVDAYGHVSVRSRNNPNHYFISRYVSPGIVTADGIIENDLDSNPVAGQRADQYNERFLHGEVYRARPDVMAIVHSHTPELVAFSVSSVALRQGDTVVPNYDIRPFNNGRSGILTNNALARSFAESLGKSDAILMLGHGAVVVGPSIFNAVSSANGLRTAARVQQQLISMGGTWDSNLRRVAAGANTQPEGAAGPSARAPGAAAAPATPTGSGGGAGGERAWEYWKQLVMPAIAESSKVAGDGRREANALAGAAESTSPDQAVIDDLVLANRMLASHELGILDAFGHVSVRSPRDPSHYFISRYVSAGVVKAGDIIENDLDSKPVGAPRTDEYQEVYMHGEIYKARPDVMAVLHAHTPEILAFTESSVTLRPVVNGGVFIGGGLPLHDIRKFDPRETIIRTPALGRSVAISLGDKPGVLLRGHGVALTDTSLRTLVVRAYNMRMNARMQQQAIALGGKVTYLEDPPAPPATPAPAGDTAYNRGWEYWKAIVSVD
ncbi:MAG TPA: class II aldolase/adducin family protein [Vicinamibacterales bacterium]|nr:class II aldolase/adducin family protein [Vicinamibacterales bacterium]